MDDNRSYGQKAFSSVLITGTAQAIKVGGQFLSIIIIARLIAAEDFGLIAAVSPVIVFISMFQDVGLQQAVIQRKDITENQLNSVFWMMVIFGSGCTLILFLLSPIVSWFYSDVRLQTITIMLAFPLLLNSIASLPGSVIIRNLDFKSTAGISICASLSQFLASISSAFMGAGYWALIIGPVIMSMTTLIGNFYVSKWKPGKLAFEIERDIFTFGANLTGFNILNYFTRNTDNILIGRYHGLTALGYYDLAYKMLLFPIRSINDPIARVMVPIMSRVQDDRDRLRRIYLRAVGLMSLITSPAIAAITFCAYDTVFIILGEKWLPIVPVFSWLGLVSLVQAVSNSSGWLFISQGKTDVMLKFAVFSAITTVISFVIGVQWGITGVAIAYMIGVYIRTPILYLVIDKLGPVTFRDYMVIQLPVLIAAFLTWLTVNFIFRDVLSMYGIQLILISVFCSYLFSIALVSLNRQGRDVLREAYSHTKKLGKSIIKNY